MIFKKIHTLENLEAAWKHVRAKRAQPGIDRVRQKDFEKNLEANLKTLQKEIADGAYRPMPVMAYKFRKQKRSFRNIGISTLRDRIVQQAVVQTLGPHCESRFLPCSYAYRRKKSAPVAVRQAGRCIQSGKLWFLSMDVANFFDKMDHGILLSLIRRIADEKPLEKLITRLLKAKIYKEMGLFDNTVGSQQGSGLSPLLSNIYLHPLDAVMWKTFKDGYLRYSDDIAVFGNEQEQLAQAQELVSNGLAELKLEPNPSKTYTAHIAAGIIYLGFYMDVKGKGPSAKSIEQIHAKLDNLAPVRKTDNIKQRLHETDLVLRGWYNYYKSVQAITPQNILTLLTLVRLSKEVGEVRYAKDLIRQHEVFASSHPELAFQIGECFYDLGMQENALREYARALELDPSLTAPRERIRLLQNTEANVHKTIEQTKLVLHRNPHFREGYAKLAECYTALGLYGFAEKAAQKALELDEYATPQVSVEHIRARSHENIHELTFTKDDQRCFLNLLQGRTGAHGRQWVDERGKSGYIRVERALKSKDVYKHLVGDETLAVFPVTERDTVRFIVFDVDISKRRLLQAGEKEREVLLGTAHADILRISAVCKQKDAALCIEDSGYKGRHGWLFFTGEVPAARAILLGQAIIKKAGPPSPDMVWELFPHGKSQRSQCLIKLPLGINKKNNRRCLFLNNDNRPYPDQMRFLHAIRPVDAKALNLLPPIMPGTDTQDITYGAKDEIMALPGLQEMANRCKILKHLILKARDTNYLTHYERVCLLYTLTFAGEPGCMLLHKVMGYCLNYDRHHTQRYIDNRKESPISCARIMENFFEIAETFCDCKFKLPPRSYPSPVLYLLEAEMDSASSKPLLGQKNTETPEPAPDESDNPSQVETEPVSEKPEKPSVLDFKSIFSEENGNAPADENDDEKTAILIQNDADEASLAITPWNAAAEVPDDKEQSLEQPTPSVQSEQSEAAVEIPSGSENVKTEAWSLFLEYLELNHKINQAGSDLKRVTAALEHLFDDLPADTLSTEIGSIRRIQKEGCGCEWVLKC